MAAVPNWLIGRHLTTITITPLTLGTTGTLTPGTLASLSGQLDEISLEFENETENIQAMDVRAKNNVITDTDFSLNLIEILKRSGVNILAGITGAYDYAQVVFTRGGQTWTCIGVIGSYRENIRRGKSTGEVTLKGVDTGGGGTSINYSTP